MSSVVNRFMSAPWLAREGRQNGYHLPTHMPAKTAALIRHERIPADGVRLHVVGAGEGHPVVLLHGFPENWRSWRHQIGPLAEAGYAVRALDLRGYNESDIPRERSAYALRHLVDDVSAIVRT